MVNTCSKFPPKSLKDEGSPALDGLAAKVAAWEAANHGVLATQRNTMAGGFFNNPITKTQEAVQKIKGVLGLGQVEEVDGFVVCK